MTDYYNGKIWNYIKNIMYVKKLQGIFIVELYLIKEKL